MIFLLSASGMFLSNELLSGMFLSNDLPLSHLVARYTYPLLQCFINYLMGSISRRLPPEESVGRLTLFRSYLSKFLSTVGSIFFKFFVLLKYDFSSLCPFQAKSVLFVCFRAIKIRWYVYIRT